MTVTWYAMSKRNVLRLGRIHGVKDIGVYLGD